MDIRELEKEINKMQDIIAANNTKQAYIYSELTEKQRCKFCGAPLLKDCANRGYEVCTCNRAQDKYDEMKNLVMETDALYKDLTKYQAEYNNTKKNKIELLNQSGMGARGKLMTFDNYSGDTGAYNKGIRYVRNFNKCNGKGLLVMCRGRNLQTKTHLAAAITNELLNQNERVIFQTGSSIFLNLSLNDIEQKRKYINDLKNTSLLVIDHLGAEKISDWNKVAFFDIINFRYNNMLPIIVTCNMSLVQLENTLSKDIVERLKEMCEIVYMGSREEQ